MSEVKIAYWDCREDVEILYHETMDEAIEAYLDDIDPEHLPESLSVSAYARKEVDRKRFKEVILEWAYEFLSENYDGEDGHEQYEPHEKAAELFVESYLKNYQSWGCYLVKTKTINPKEWIKTNRPHWCMDCAR